MEHIIYNWKDISEKFKESILLGNGASISVDKNFNYKSMKSYGMKNFLFDKNIIKLFDAFKTDDFELILRLLWQANRINKALSIKDETTQLAYKRIRECLILIVNKIHSVYEDINVEFENIKKFLRGYKTVLSLNYDLILYWVIMYSNGHSGHKFKDCFRNGFFDEDWSKFRDSISVWDQETTLCFYPHGNLMLARNIKEEEFKLIMRREDYDLLDSIKNRWKSGEVVPLFVSEGSSKQKIASIQKSHYLSTVYREVIPSLKDDLTIYGWGMTDNDYHILHRIKESTVSRIAVSVYQRDYEYCDYVMATIRKEIKRKVEVVFFDSNSDGCWNQP